METGASPASPMPALAELFREQQRTLSRFLSIPLVIETARRTQVGTSPHDIVLRDGTHTLLRYRRETPATQAEPVLLCYALVNRPYILDLQSDKSVVRQYLAKGFDVYMIDWGAPTYADRGLTVDHYVNGFLARAVEVVRRAHQGNKVHLLGYCMGGTLSALHGAQKPESLKTLTLLAAPIDFAVRDSLLNLWTGNGVFDVDALLAAHGNCPAWFLQSCFLFMSPIRNFVDKAIAFYEQMDDPRSMANHFALERWLNDNIPVAGETFRTFVKNLFQRNELVRGELVVGGQRIDLRRITCPLLLLTASADHLVAPASTEGIRPHVGARDVTSMGIRAGHVGLVVGGKAHATFWPEVTRWTAERSTPAALAPTVTATVSATASAAAARPAPPTQAHPSPPHRPVRRGNDFAPVWWAHNR